MAASAFDFRKSQNIVTNAIMPFNPMRFQLAIGSVEYVAWEVIVTKLLRTLLGYSKKSVFELLQVHAVSLTFMGGAQGFVGAPGSFDDDLFTQLQDGAKGIPAVLLAKYTIDTCYKGFHVPFSSWSMADITISAASKAISRPLFSLLYPYIKGKMTQPLETVNELVRKQALISNFNMKK